MDVAAEEVGATLRGRLEFVVDVFLRPGDRVADEDLSTRFGSLVDGKVVRRGVVRDEEKDDFCPRSIVSSVTLKRLPVALSRCVGSGSSAPRERVGPGVGEGDAVGSSSSPPHDNAARTMNPTQTTSNGRITGQCAADHS